LDEMYTFVKYIEVKGKVSRYTNTTNGLQRSLEKIKSTHMSNFFISMYWKGSKEK